MKMVALLGMEKISLPIHIDRQRGLLLRIWVKSLPVSAGTHAKKKLWKPRKGILIKFTFGMSLPGVDE